METNDMKKELERLEKELQELKIYVNKLHEQIQSQKVETVKLKRGVLIRRRKMGRALNGSEEYHLLCLDCAFDWREILHETELKSTTCPKCNGNNLDTSYKIRPFPVKNRRYTNYAR